MATRYIIDCATKSGTEFNNQLIQIRQWLLGYFGPLAFEKPNQFVYSPAGPLDSSQRRNYQHTLIFIDDADAALFRLSVIIDGTWHVQPVLTTSSV